MSVDPPHPGLTAAWSDLVEVGLVEQHRAPEIIEHPAGQRVPIGWVSPSLLRRRSTWDSLAANYSNHLGTPHRAVGAACALQYLTGRLATAFLGLWARTGSTLDVQVDRWRVLLDASARTRSVWFEAVEADSNVALSQAVHDLREHLSPMVDAAQRAGGITARLGWGSVATSCVGALARVQRVLPAEASERLCAQAVDTLDGVAWGTGRALVSCRTLPGPHGVRLVHERHTCCLIRLGRDGRVCGTCPQQSDAARRVHAAEVVAIPNATRTLVAGFGS